MPARQPFTRLCQLAARPVTAGRADLHLHTTHSDGEYTPAQVVDLARRSGLAAVALTDHDTVGEIAAARGAAGSGLEVVPGVEISAEYEGRELHLLGYFFRPDDPALLAALAGLRRHRAERFRTMAGRLRGLGLSVEDEELDRLDGATALGRRHLAVLLAESGQVGSPAEAFAGVARPGRDRRQRLSRPRRTGPGGRGAGRDRAGAGRTAENGNSRRLATLRRSVRPEERRWSSRRCWARSSRAWPGRATCSA